MLVYLSVVYLMVEPTHLKNMLVKMGIFPNFRGEHKIYLKPPPSILSMEEILPHLECI